MALLPFAQLDFAGEVPIDDGRYLVRPPGDPDADPDVIALKTLGTSVAKRGLRRGRAQPVADPTKATAITMTRLTYVKAAPFGSEEEAGGWLDGVTGSPEVARELAAEAARALNRALRAHRAAASDPYAADLHPGAAVAIRFGYGTGDQVAEGRWSEALSMPERERRELLAKARSDAGPQERVAEALGGRDDVAPYEELLLAARRALNERRRNEAAVMCEAAARSMSRTGAGAREAEEALLALREPESSPPDAEQLREILIRLTKAGREGGRGA